MKTFIQTVYIPRENILFLEEWLEYHSNLGIDEFYLYDNSGSRFKDFVGNLEINGKNKNGWNVKELTKNISDGSIDSIEKKLFKKFKVTKIKWSPKDAKGQITYGQTLAINNFVNIVKKGFCVFIDIDEFVVLKNHNNIKDYLKDMYIVDHNGIKIFQKKHLNRWYKKENEKVFDLPQVLEINTEKWAPKIIANIERIGDCSKKNIHNFLSNLKLDKSFCYFNHYNHDENGHKWLLNNYRSLDPNWKPIKFNKIKLK
jgi:hypothetical protein